MAESKWFSLQPVWLPLKITLLSPTGHCISRTKDYFKWTDESLRSIEPQDWLFIIIDESLWNLVLLCAQVMSQLLLLSVRPQLWQHGISNRPLYASITPIMWPRNRWHRNRWSAVICIHHPMDGIQPVLTRQPCQLMSWLSPIINCCFRCHTFP